MPGVTDAVLPPGWQAKLYFVMSFTAMSLMHYIAKIEFLRNILQPYTERPLTQIASFQWNQITFISKVLSLNKSRSVKEGGKYVDIPLYTLNGEKTMLSSYFKGLHSSSILAVLAEVSNYSALVNKYAEHATFLTIYIREAHPSDGEWPQDGNPTKMHRQLSDRLEAAKLLEESGVPGVILADSLDDLACIIYGALPEALILIDQSGKIRYLSDIGPVGYKPPQLEAALRKLCNIDE